MLVRPQQNERVMTPGAWGSLGRNSRRLREAAGYTEEERNILNPMLRETIREFAALDGAFVISSDGLVLTAGRHLGAAGQEDQIPRGLGSRHIAASGITALSNAVAIVISESTGDLRIFKNGKILMEIEKPIQATTPV